MPCVNCKSDVPSRHYYQQCQQLCTYSTCTNSMPHWGNNCPQLMAHLKAKRAFHASFRENDKVDYAFEKQKQRKKKEWDEGFSIQEVNDRFEGMSTTHSAILDSGANSTYVINRCLLDNHTSPTSHSVTVADGSIHPIVTSGTLVGHPSIAADFVPSFTSNLIVLPTIIKTGVMTGDKMTMYLCLQQTLVIQSLYR